jgi:hypothetical protein
MAEGLMLTHTKASVQQKDTLLCPSCQVAALGNRRPRLSLYLLKDILKRRRELHTVVHTEAKPMSLTGFMVRILSQDNHPHLVKRRSIESVEDKPSRGVTNAGAILRANEPCQFLKVWLLKFFIKTSLPALFNPYIH